MIFNRILCGVDFSETSLEAFRLSAEIARRFASDLYLLHVIEARPVVPTLIGDDMMGEMAVELEEKATAALESLVESSSSDLEGIPLTLQITAGRAFAEILNHARDWQVDLIVLGAKGATAVEQIVVGGTAERVMKDAPCSTLIVKLIPLTG
jgi:nucleotide-binding universal stress UspA family protein